MNSLIGELRNRTCRPFIPCRMLAGAALGAALLVLLAACGGGSSSSSPTGPSLTGSVVGDLQPVAGAVVVAWDVGTGAGDTPVELGSDITDSNGDFKINFLFEPSAGDLVYLGASEFNPDVDANPAVVLMSVAGTWCDPGTQGCSFPAGVTINELSTAAAASVFQNYIQFVPCVDIPNDDVGGTCVTITAAQGLAKTVQTLGNLIDVTSGAAADFLTAQPDTSPLHATLERMNTLAGIIANCVGADVSVYPNACSDLFAQTGVGSFDTLEAAWRIANDPDVNADGTGLFALLPGAPAFMPVLAAAPVNWTIGGQRFAYVANAAGSVSAWRIDAASGAMTPVTTGATNCYPPPVGGVAANAGGPPPDPDNCYAAGIAPAAIAASPDGRFVYVANCNGHDISAYAIDPGTGALVAIVGSPFDGGVHPFSVAVGPSGHFLYETDIGNTVSVSSIDPASGALSAIAGSPFAGGNQPYSVVLDPASSYAYTVNNGGNDVSAWNVDQETGALAPIAGASCGDNLPANCFAAGAGAAEAAMDPLGRFVYVANYDGNSISAWAIAPVSSAEPLPGGLVPIPGSVSCGANLPADCFAAAASPVSPAVDPSGNYLYVADYDGNGISAYMIDASTGALIAVAGSPFADAHGPISVAVDAAGSFVYVAGFNDNTVSVYGISADTGELAAIAGSPFPAGPGADAVAVSP